MPQYTIFPMYYLYKCRNTHLSDVILKYTLIFVLIAETINYILLDFGITSSKLELYDKL